MQVPVQAAVPASAAPGAATSSVRIPYEPACGAPKKGEVTCLALHRTDVKPVRGVRPAATAPTGLGAADLQSAYNLPTDGGAGQTVAIVDAFDDPNAEADLAVYRQQYGLPPCTTENGCFKKVSQRGGTDYPRPDASWAGEISIDVDMVSAAAPNAHILLVEADDTSWQAMGASVDEAVALGAKYVSNSYGTDYRFPGAEDPSETTEQDAHYNHPGVAMVAASGDYGYGVGYPAASPYVTAVGGTALTRDPGSARGWAETAWNSAGSGCSLYEPKPAFQTDTGCANRTVADVAGVADPATPVAVYQTYGDGGWTVFGGTSVASPIIAGVYAAAGTPSAGTYPNSYPYSASGVGLNDISGGSNGSCSPAYLCTGAAGYDGPTGLGTPDGLGAFRSGPHGQLSGTVTDSATGKPLSAATVTAGTAAATHTGADGTYSFALPVGSYDLTVDAYGYSSGTAKAVAVADGDALTKDFALEALPSQTVSGKVTDGSGHGWPLYAKITVDGANGGPVWTDPATGNYSLTLPQGHEYTLRVSAASAGYHEATRTVTVGDTAQKLNLPMTVDPFAATAPGYAVHLTGPTETFDSTTSAPQGWSVANAEGSDGGWQFDDPGARGNDTGGSGGFAVLDSDHFGPGNGQDSQLISPVYDLTGKATPQVAFNTMYRSFPGQTLAVDASSDGGATWSTLWSEALADASQARVELPLTDFAGKPAVQVRFHYTGTWGYYWGIDNVSVGERDAVPTPGGLVTGTVTDTNTGSGVAGATVTSQDDPAVNATTADTPDDPNTGGGYYSLFSPQLGSHGFSVTRAPYTSLSRTVKVGADSTVSADYKLKAGRLTVTPGSVEASATLGTSTTKKLTVKNTGGAPATLKVVEKPGTFQLQAVGGGAPLQRIKGHYSPLVSTPAAGTAAKPAAGPSGTDWQTAPDLPQPTSGNAVGSYQGKVYSGFGFIGTGWTSDLYVLDPSFGSWTRLASAADQREAPASGFINGKFYVSGGWDNSGSGATDSKTEIYDPATDSWSTGAPSPSSYAGAGSAVVDGELYTVGGCTEGCGTTYASSYDPATDRWAQIAPYPDPVSWESCAGIDGELYCAGGSSGFSDSEHAYVYDPNADRWSPIADMPAALWASAYASADGQLVVSGGLSGGALTNQGYAYDPQAGAWSALPNANVPTFRGGAGLGFYKVGGNVAPSAPVTAVELLPGYNQDTTDVNWLSESPRQVTLQPGASSVITVTLDSSVPGMSQPGDYDAQLRFVTDTAYTLPKMPVTFHVTPPKTWGKITGTVLGATANGGTTPLAGATVQINSWAAVHSLRTGADGTYALWLDTRNNPLQVIVARDGYQPTVATVKLVKGDVVTGDYTLKKQ